VVTFVEISFSFLEDFFRGARKTENCKGNFCSVPLLKFLGGAAEFLLLNGLSTEQGIFIVLTLSMGYF